MLTMSTILNAVSVLYRIINSVFVVFSAYFTGKAAMDGCNRDFKTAVKNKKLGPDSFRESHV